MDRNGVYRWVIWWVANIWSYFNPPSCWKCHLRWLQATRETCLLQLPPWDAKNIQKPLPHASSQLTVTCDHSVLWTWKSNFVNLQAQLLSQPTGPIIPVCCLPIGKKPQPTSRAKHGECCCYRWLLKFEVKRLAAWCGGLQRLHLGVARHPKVSGMPSPQVCRVDLWGCDNKFSDLDRRLATVLDLKLS